MGLRRGLAGPGLGQRRGGLGQRSAIALMWLVADVTASQACQVDVGLLGEYTRKAEQVFRGRVITFAVDPEYVHIEPRFGFLHPDYAALIGWLRVEKVYRGRVPHYVRFSAIRGNSCAIRKVYVGQELYVVNRVAQPVIHLGDMGPFPLNHYPDAWWKGYLGRLGLAEQLRMLRRIAMR